MILCILGKSGSGKSTLKEYLLNSNIRYKRLEQYTTRAIRDNEKDGIHYKFVSNDEFDKLIQSGDIIIERKYNKSDEGLVRYSIKNVNTIKTNTDDIYIIILDYNG